MKYDQTESNHVFSVEQELERRCLWASWASLQITEQPESYLRSIGAEMTGVPLPSEVRPSGNDSQILSTHYMNCDWHIVTSVMEVNECNLTVAAGIVILIGVW